MNALTLGTRTRTLLFQRTILAGTKTAEKKTHNHNKKGKNAKDNHITNQRSIVHTHLLELGVHDFITLNTEFKSSLHSFTNPLPTLSGLFNNEGLGSLVIGRDGGGVRTHVRIN